jgi:hypothetical protein
VDVLREYASQWKVARGTWKFLTGEADAVRRVCDLFGVDFFPDEGLMNHSLRTAVIDRTGRLAGRIEGNEYTAAQLAATSSRISCDRHVRSAAAPVMGCRVRTLMRHHAASKRLAHPASPRRGPVAADTTAGISTEWRRPGGESPTLTHRRQKSTLAGRCTPPPGGRSCSAAQLDRSRLA